MGNREIFNKIITERKTKSSNKKPKYGMRKLTVGVVSCLLGYMMFFTPNVSQAEKVEETPQVASEIVSPLNETNTVEVNNPEVSNKNEDSEVTAKPNTEGETVTVAEATQERKQSEDFNAETKEIEVEKNGAVNYKEAITNLPADASVKPSAEIDTSKPGKHTIAVDINFADGSTTTVNITINVIEKANADKPNDLELGEKIGSDQSVKAPADNTVVAPDPSIPFGKTKARVVIEKNGLNGEFPFDTIFASGTTKVTLVTVDENGDDVETKATINASTGEMTFDNIVDMQAVKDGDVFIEFNGEKIKGKFKDSYEGPDYGHGGATNITTFKLILNQIRNTDVVVNTKDKTGNVVDNPTTDVTNGKIKKGDTTVDIPIKDNVVEIDDIDGLSSEKIDDFNNKKPEYSVEGTENGFLVNKNDNKVYKPGEFKIDEKGLDPTVLEFTEKPLVTTSEDAGNDEDYVKVTFVVGDKGETPSETSNAVIRGVNHGGKISAPANPTGKKGYTFKEWSNDGVKDVYNKDTRHEAIFNVVAPTGKNITAELNSTPDAASAIANTAELPDGTSFEWQATPDTSTAGDKTATVVVKYPDGTTKNVDVTVTVADSKKDNEKYEPQASLVTTKITVAPTEKDIKDAITVPGYDKEYTVSLDDPSQLVASDVETTYPVDATVTYADGSKDKIQVSVKVVGGLNTDYEPSPVTEPIKTDLNKVPDASNGITNKNDLPEDTRYEWTTQPDVSKTWDTTGTVKVIYPDNSFDEVEVPVKVVDSRKDNEKYTATVTPIQKENGQKTTADEVTGAVKTDYPADAEKQPEIKLKDGQTLPDGKTEGTHNVTVVVTYPDGTSEEVTVPVIVGKDTRTDAEKNDPEAATSAEGTTLETELNVLPKAEDGIGNKDKLTNVKQYVWSQVPDVSKVGDTTGKVLIQYNDGSTDEVEVPVKVVDSRKDNEKYTATVTPIQKENGQKTTADEVTGAVKTDYPADAEKQPEIKLKDGQTLPDGKTEGTHNVTVVVTYPDGTSEEVTVPVIVGKDTRTDAEKNDPEAATSAEGTTLETELNVLPKAEDGIGNKDKLTNVKQYVWSQVPDVSKVGDTTGKVLIQYNDGSTDEVEVPVKVVDSRKDNEKNPAVDPAKTEVKDKTALTDEEKAKVVEEVKKANPEAKDVTVGDDGKATLTYEDGSTNEIPGDKTVTETPKQCLTPEGLKEEFKPVIEEMFDGVKGKDSVYEGKLDSENEEVVVTIKDPSKKAVELKGTGLATGLEKLFKENNLVKIKVGSQDERDLKQLAAAQPSSGMTLQQLFATIFGTDVLNEVQKTGDKTGTLADFIGKEVKIVLSVQQEGCTEFTNVVYTIKGIDGSITPAEEYQAIFNGNGGTPTTQKVTVKDGEVVSGVTEPTREGYKFVKWVKLGTDEEFDLSKPFSKDILGGEKSVIFTAVWEKVVSEDTTAPTIDAGNITAVEGQPIPPVMVDVDDVNATVTVEGLPEALKYNPETKQIEGTVPKAEDWGDDEEKTITATIKAVDEAGNESTKEITVTILRDTDGDGTPDVTDPDDDNDGVDDKTEEEKGTDPKDKDSKPSTTAESTDPTIPEKTGVKDPGKLTDREKEEVKNKIEEANKDKFPEGTIVDVDDKGNATITYPDGSKDTIPAEDLVFEYKHGDPEIDDRPELPISDIIEPTVPGKTDVGDKDNLTDKEKEEIKDKIEEANKDNFPDGTKVEVDDKGNATITYPDGSKDTIPADKLVNEKSTGDNPGTTDPTDPTDPTKPGDDQKPGDDNKPGDDQKPGDDNKPGDDQKPGDDNKPSDDNKPTDKTIADKVDPAVPGKIEVKDPTNLTKDEKDKVKEAIEKANKDKFPQGTKVEIGNDGSATITYPDGSKDTIKGSDLVEKIADAPTRPSKPSKQDKPAKKLPKAGIESEAMMMAAAALSTLGGLYVSKKKKEDEE